MIMGVGTDLCRMERFVKVMKNPAFRRRVFSEAEQRMLERLGERRRVSSAAANFAAKEAFLKACGRGLDGWPLNELSILRRESGRPCFVLEGSAAQWASEEHIVAHVSLTHEGEYAGAVVILERMGETNRLKGSEAG